MPFYEYECQACKYYTELMQKISDAPLTKCPSCGKRALKKLVSAPVFRLKGGGWYETDFKSDKENKRNLLGADKEESKPGAKVESTEAKTEAKEVKETKATKEAKDTKDTKDTKEAKPAAEPKAAAASAGRRKSVSVPGRPSRTGAHPSRRAAARRGAGKRRR
jgi:putative FmdB family regulatory protein